MKQGRTNYRQHIQSRANSLLSWRTWLWALLLVPFLASCSEEDNEVVEYPNWLYTNQTYWNDLYAATQQKIAAGDASWKIIPSFSVNGSADIKSDQNVIVHVINQGDGTVSPIYTDTVSVHYRGKLLPSTTYTSGFQFDSSYTGDLNPATARPSKFAVSGVVDGFSTALQSMHVGDRWEVYIPYALGYGATQTSSSSVPAYSTLIFDLSLVSFWHPGDVVPAYK